MEEHDMTQYGNQYGNQQYGNQQQQYGNQGGYDQNQGGGQRQNSGFDNHAKIQIIGRIVKDPTSEMKGTGKVATAKIAVNHRNEKDGTDFWFVEVWGNEGADSKHNFLVNHCPKGRKVFIEGTPTLRQTQKDGNYTYYPTIKIDQIIGLDGGKEGGNQGGGQAQPQGGYNQPPSGQYGGAPQGQYPPAQQNNQYPPAQQQGQYQAPPQQGGFPPAPQQGQYNAPPAPPAPQGQPGAFPPNVPGGGYGAPAPQGVAPGAPNANGGFPPVPQQ
jgi:single-strand DNA-binding protein